MSQEAIKVKLDKINSLFDVFFKDGIENTSKLERDLLKIQLNSLISELDNFEDAVKVEQGIVEKVEVNQEELILEKESAQKEIVEKLTQEVVETIIEENEVEVQENKEEHKTPTLQFLVDEKSEVETATQSEEKVFSTNPPTRDLKQVIDLNKSFVLRAELFANNNEEYSSFINKLSTLENEESSFNFVEETAAQKAWDKEEKVYELLLRAVEKRFLPLI